MLYLIYGEDIVSSRNKLNELVHSSENVVYINGKKTTAATLEMELKSEGLFGNKKTLVIEHFSKFKPPEKLVDLFAQIEKDQNTTVILWDEAKVPVKILNSLKSARAFVFDFPKVYFTFLDGLSPDNSSGSLKLLKEVLNTYMAEQVLYSIVKRIRHLLLIKLGAQQESSEFKGMQGWQIAKLRQQANKWSDSQLKNAFISYIDLDEMIKTSGLTMDLSAHLDIILMSDLN